MKKTLIKYSIVLFIGLIVGFLVTLCGDIFNLTDKGEILKWLCNGFFVPGIILVGVGSLVLVSSSGFFDIFGYSFSILFQSKNWMPGKRFEERESYADYKLRKSGKRYKTPWFIFIVGFAFVLVSFIFYAFYALAIEGVI